MRYTPYDAEYSASITMTDTQLLEYFLTRVFETEEVWGLDDGVEWIMRDDGGETTMPLWPYQQYATESAQAYWPECKPQAQSLEDFISTTLAMLIDEAVMVEIMPRSASLGCLISPERLFSILDGMMEAGEYTMDG